MATYILIPFGGMEGLLWTLLSLATLALVAIPLYRITFHPLAKYPGPTSWAISRIPWHRSLHRGRLHHDLHTLHLTYGDIVRIAPDELSIIHPDAYRDIHVTRAGHKLLPKNDIWFRRPKDDVKKGASIMGSDEAGHARLKRAFAGAFTEQGVNDMGPVVLKHSRLMVKQLTKIVDRAVAGGETGAVIDLVNWLNLVSFDISGELSFGEGFGSIEAEKAHPWVEINYLFGKGVAFVVSLNFLWPLGKVLSFIVPKAVGQKFVYHQELTTEKVGKRLSEGKGKADFLGSVERYNEDCERKGQPEKMVSRSELNINMSIFVFAGSETSSSGLSSIFRYLLGNSRAKVTLLQELDSHFSSGSDIAVNTVSQLPYLGAVIQEGLRLGPPVAVHVPRTIPPGGETICGEHLPEGIMVSITPYVANRSSTNFRHAEQFIPERFMKSEEHQGDRLEIFQPFSQGRHMCLGYRLAWLMMRMLVAQLLYEFDVELVDKMGDFGQQKTFIFWEKEPLLVKLRKRKSVMV